MTEQEKRDLSDAKLSLANIQEGSPTLKVWERVLDDWQRKDERLACIENAVTEALPHLHEAFRRYGCEKPDACGSCRCPNGYPCVAGRLYMAAQGIRACLVSEDGGK